MAHKRGNPNWGKPAPTVPAAVVETEFEKQLRQMRLNERTCAGSNRLREWCERNKNRVYIPEALLKQWKMSVDNIKD